MAKKESALESMFDKLTPEKLEKMRKRRLKARASLSLISQLGRYVGEDIVRKYLPTLSVDAIHTPTNISVTCAEGDECRRLEDVWFSKRAEYRRDDDKGSKASEKEWEALRAYHEMLEEKYLPKTVECYFSCLNISERNMKKFKEAISVALWDCDCSHYSVDPKDIDVKVDDDGYFTTITLKKA